MELHLKTSSLNRRGWLVLQLFICVSCLLGSSTGIIFKRRTSQRHEWQSSEPTVPAVTSETRGRIVLPGYNYTLYTESQCRRECRANWHVCAMVSLTKFICCSTTEELCKKYVKAESMLLDFAKIAIDPSSPCKRNPCENGGTCHSVGPVSPVASHRDSPPPYQAVIPAVNPPPYAQIPPPGFYDSPRTSFYRTHDPNDPTSYFVCDCKEKYTGKVCQFVLEAIKKGNERNCDTETCGHGKCIKTSLINQEVLANAASVVSTAKIEEISDILRTSYKYKNNQVCLCNVGYRGMTCAKACDPKTWGFYCLNRCDENCELARCEPEEGKCPCIRGYNFSEEFNICKPVIGNGKCKKYCNQSTGHCVHETCSCNSRYIGGVWCEKSCSAFIPPRWSRGCSKVCGACWKLPCNRKNGICSIKPGHARCSQGFLGAKCSEIIDTMHAWQVSADLQIYMPSFFHERGKKFTRIFKSSKALRQLRREVVVGIHDAVATQTTNEGSTGVVVRVQSLEPSESLNRRRRASKDKRQSPENKIEVQVEIYTPAVGPNTSKPFQKMVKSSLVMLSRRFRSAILPELRVNKDSIKVRKVKMVLASDINTNTGPRISTDVEQDTSLLQSLAPAAFFISFLMVMVGCVLHQRRSKSGGRVYRVSDQQRQ